MNSMSSTLSSTSMSVDFALAPPRCLQPAIHRDSRGQFVKTWHPDLLRAQGITMEMAEEFYSSSKAGVIRGMHFQEPPEAVEKLVYCVAGEVLDVVLDLRRASPDFGKVFTWHLSPANGYILHLPAGCAHGFLGLKEDNVMVYKMSGLYSPQHDKGLRWDSFDFAWPTVNPILSERDRLLPRWSDFTSPF